MFLKNIIFTFTVLLLLTSCNAKKSGLNFDTDKDELTNNVSNYVLFDVDSARLDPQARSVLDEQSNWLEMNSNINVIIEGHCDERGTREYNLALGAKRANSVKSYLTSSGINSSRIATISYGKERPVVQGTGRNVWRENRRAITLVN
jgi:peptidoglycan-associated lipoprotein